jgi:hypothetical protein
VTLLDPAPTHVDYKRDRWGRPLIVPAGGGKPKPYTRASSAAKAIEDTFGLEMWARRNVAFGLATDPSLVARVIALGGTPHTWTADDKKAVGKVCEDAANIAQAHKGADIGTAVHRMVERINLGEDVDGGPYRADLDAYRQAVAAMGWTIDPELVECRMVCDELEMAGTCDLIVDTASGMFVADLKTGSSVTFGGLGYGAQLAAYAHGDLYDPATDTRRPLEIWAHIGYIIHLPAGEGVCTIYEVDIANGYAAAKLANEVRAVRKASRTWLTEVTATPQPVVEGETPGDIRNRWASPAEGEPSDVLAVDQLKDRYTGLADRSAITALATEAQQAGVSFHLKEARTARRYHILWGLVTLAEADALDEDAVRILTSTALDSDAAQFPTVTAGHALGALDATTAQTFADLCAVLAAGRGVVTVDADTTFSRFAA